MPHRAVNLLSYSSHIKSHRKSCTELQNRVHLGPLVGPGYVSCRQRFARLGRSVVRSPPAAASAQRRFGPNSSSRNRRLTHTQCILDHCTKGRERASFVICQGRIRPFKVIRSSSYRNINQSKNPVHGEVSRLGEGSDMLRWEPQRVTGLLEVSLVGVL